VINSQRAHRRATVEFFAAHLPGCAKRVRFQRWCDELQQVTPIVEPCRPPPVGDSFLMGYVAGDGSFVRSGRRYRFAVAVSAVDHTLLLQFAARFGVGGVDRVRPRESHHREVSIYRVGSVHDLRSSVIPVVDAALLPRYKRTQFDRWQASLEAFWTNEMRRSRECSTHGCHRPRRAKGLCRQHYFRAFGR
jgi:hypothetical protein